MKRLIALITLLFIIVLTAVAPAVDALVSGSASEPSGITCREPAARNSRQKFSARLFASISRPG
jgi:hypothetical protein